MAFKRSAEVKFRTRSDRPLQRGKVVRTHSTARGDFIEIKDGDGVSRKVRPVNVQAA